MPSDPVTAVAEAVQEVAKVTGKGIDAVTELCHFVSDFTREPIAEGLGIVADRLRFIRVEQQHKFFVRARERLIEAGLERPTRAIPLNFAIPLLEQASLEEDDSLQGLWANLLVNAANAKSKTEIRRTFISILEQLTPVDALIMLKVYSLPLIDGEEPWVITDQLPGQVRYSAPDETVDAWAQPSATVKLSLANLARVGCLDLGDMFGGPKSYTHIGQTVLGRAFFDAVTLQRTMG